MTQRLLIVFLLLAFAGPLWAQSDPLNAAYKPAIDCTPADYPSNVSLTNSLAKLRQNVDSPTSITGYGTTPLPCVTIYGTQNAFADFQAHIQAPVGGYAGLTFTMSAMTKSTGPGGAYTIPAPDATHNDIVVSREWYGDITTPNQLGHIWFDAAGNYPDVLVPAIDPYWHQTTAAFPVAVAANQNQSAWVDIYIPQAALSGWYSGTITISDSTAGTIATLPVLLGVWQWPAADGGFMPSASSLPTVMPGASDFNGGICNPNVGYTTTATCTSTYSGTGSNGPIFANNDLIPLFIDHRITQSTTSGSAGNITTLGSFNTNETHYENGTATARLNSIIPGAKQEYIEFNHGPVSAGQATTLQTWMTLFSGNGWPTYNYQSDEPGSTCANWDVTQASAMRGYSTPNIPIMITGNLSQATTCSALNAVDILVVNQDDMEPGGKGGSTSNQRSTYNTWLSGNCCSGTGPTRQVWEYISCDPTCGTGIHSGYPQYALDVMSPASEALEWLAFNNQVNGILYYLLDGCLYGAGGCSSPWGNQSTAFDVYGDGNLLAVGTNSTNCSGCGGAWVNVSTPIWLPTIRLQLMRDGQQDYEYLHYLNSLGGSHATVVSNAVNEWILNGYCFNASSTAGATVSDASSHCSTTFTGDLTDAKIALGNDMQTLTFPAGGGTLSVPTNPILLSVKVAHVSGSSGGVVVNNKK